jgi:4-hydroxybenzoate polyprenyltransferase
LAAGALLFVWQQWRASTRDRASCLAAFRHNNYFGLVVLLGMAAAYASQ